jgi:vacuolar-type H+-ATPase subunit E/Vma4
MLDAKVGDEMEELNGVYTPQLEKKLEVFDEYKRLVMEAVDEVIEQVRKQAEQEAARIIGEASRKAKQIAEKTVANAEKAQYAILTESRAIARETTANIEQLTSTLATMQEEIDNLVGILGEQARGLTETAQKLETMIIDTREKAHTEIAERLQVIQELNQRIKQVVEGTPRAGEKEVEHIGRDKEAGLASGERKEPVAQPTVSATQDNVLPPSDEDRQFLGTVELVIISPNSPELRKKFLNCLPAATGLDLQGSPESVGKKKTQMVYLPKPVPLVKILRQMAMVKSANEDGRGIIEIVLEAADQWRG